MDDLREKLGRSLLPRIALVILSILPVALLLPGFWDISVSDEWHGTPSKARLMIGCIIIAAGVLRAVDLYCRRRWDKFYLDVLFGLLFISAGVILVTYRGTGMWAVTPILSLYFVSEGAVKIHLASEFQTEADICLMIAGTLSLIRGTAFMYYGFIPDIYLWALALFIGIDLFLEGICGITRKLALNGHATGTHQS